ncbi:O-methyltransferase [Pseudomonas aeruginosa]|nr:O-methyltransferase [Pseudomonas aeruginosa]
MNTLTNAPLADLLQRLFAEAEASAPGDSPALADLSEAELKRLMGSKTEYREFYGRLKDLALPVSRETGCLLYMLARQLGAQHRRVRHVLRPVHPAPRRSAAGQRRWPPDRQRVRTLQGRAGTAQPGRRGAARPGGTARG